MTDVDRLESESRSMAPHSAALPPFFFLWSFAILYHQVFHSALVSSPLDVGLLVGLVTALLRPEWLWALGVVSTLHIGVVVVDLPVVANHWYFSGLGRGPCWSLSLGPGGRGGGKGGFWMPGP